MAPEPSSSTLSRRIELELADVESRAADLRNALAVIQEFSKDAAVVIDGRKKDTVDELPDAVKSRLTEHKTDDVSTKSKPTTLDLHQT